MFRFFIGAAVVLALGPSCASAQARRPVVPTDIYRVRDVGAPRVSPDGQWVAYTIATVDSAKDKSDTDIWMTSWDGTRTLRMTSSPEGESQPDWSPDNKYLSFVSGRFESKGGQVWLLNRAGGEAAKLTDFKGGVSAHVWSPDGTRIAVVAHDPDPDEGKPDSVKAKSPKPIVIDRYHFKADVTGYLDHLRDHLYVVDVATKKVTQVTTGDVDDEAPRWSPDGTRLAFVSRRGQQDPDRQNNTDIFVVKAEAGATPVQLTTWAGPDDSPTWSPDGTRIAYRQGSEPNLFAYGQEQLAIVPSTGGAPLLPTAALDRDVSNILWSPDGASVVFRVTDDRTEQLATVFLADARVTRLLEGPRVISQVDGVATGHIVVRAATAATFPELFAVEQGKLRALTHVNDSLLAQLQLGSTEGISFKNKDGQTVGALLVKPATFEAGKKYPLVLRIHGGPNGQDEYSFAMERELLAAQGYLVLAVNYRGSSGRGQAWKKAIYADWGNKEVQDLLAGVDHVIGLGLADPAHLGVGGWSYGGILTDYLDATTTRFKAATSGAGSALQTTMYGTDQYIYQYETELGAPWKNPKAWEKVSYSFYQVERVQTPTLFLGGEKDFNVPVIGGEQMYQALKSLGVETQLVIYPGQFHGITRPSFVRDRYERYLGWSKKYL